MTFNETGFRPFYHNFTAIPLKDSLKPLLQDFPGAESANGILTYGYIDPERGLTLEVLAAAKLTEKGVSYAAGNDEIRAFIRIREVADDEFFFLADKDGKLADRFAGKLEQLHTYDVSEPVEESRKMNFLDECRDKEHVDEVRVLLLREGLDPEECHVRITDLGDRCLIGTLLNEPCHDFGCHAGETITFFLNRNKDDKVVCLCDMTPVRKITEEDLEDGSMLEEAIHLFNEERTKEHLLDILEILRDSWVWVPCTAVMSEEDQRHFQELIEQAGDDLESIKDHVYQTQGETRLIPDILQNGDSFFFPAFTTVEAMGEYGNNFSKVQKHMLEVIPLARNNERKPCGIVINAFTEDFVLTDTLYDVVEKMRSRIE